jgi:hypothetical protein
VDETPVLASDLDARATGRIELHESIEQFGDESTEELLNEDVVIGEEETKCGELTTSVTESVTKSNQAGRINHGSFSAKDILAKNRFTRVPCANV